MDDYNKFFVNICHSSGKIFVIHLYPLRLVLNSYQKQSLKGTDVLGSKAGDWEETEHL